MIGAVAHSVYQCNFSAKSGLVSRRVTEWHIILCCVTKYSKPALIDHWPSVADVSYTHDLPAPLDQKCDVVIACTWANPFSEVNGEGECVIILFEWTVLADVCTQSTH